MSESHYTATDLHQLRTIPKVAPLVGVSKSELYRWAGAGRLKWKNMASTKGRVVMRTTLQWALDAVAALPDGA